MRPQLRIAMHDTSATSARYLGAAHFVAVNPKLVRSSNCYTRLAAVRRRASDACCPLPIGPSQLGKRKIRPNGRCGLGREQPAESIVIAPRATAAARKNATVASSWLDGQRLLAR